MKGATPPGTCCLGTASSAFLPVAFWDNIAQIIGSIIAVGEYKVEARSIWHWLIFIAWPGMWSGIPQVATESPVTPIQAELVKRLEASKVSIGDSVLARVQMGWKGSSCELRPGDIVQGRIVFRRPYSKTEKISEVAVLFENGQCGGPAMKPLPLTIAAIVSADLGGDPTLEQGQERQALSDAVGLTLNGGTRSVTHAAETVYNEPSRTVYVTPRRAAPPKKLKPGQVIGISHLRLTVGTGPEGSSILSSTGRELRLDAGTQFVLVPISGAKSGSGPGTATPATVASSPTTKVESALPDSPKIADETEVCVPPSCHVDFEDSQPETHNADLILPLKALGYSPPPANLEMSRFDFHTGMAFLGPNQLLFTFDPHLLVKRTNSEAISFLRLRIIRAVVVDLATRQVVRSVDWRVPDSAQYLWPLGKEEVLVHVGDELRVYGPGLEQRQKISLGAPLAFVRTSPSSTYFAVGVVNERHTPEIHRQLQEAEGREPEEDVEVRVLDSNLHPLTKVMRSSRSAFPVLVDDGEVRVLRIGENQWRIVKYSWAGERQVLAQARSTCLPSLQSLAGDLLFVVGCDRQGGKWFRVLRNGKVLLKGVFFSQTIEHTASGNANGNIFAIRIAQAKQSFSLAFHPSDLQSERIALYSAKTGQCIFAVNNLSTVPAVQTFAISPAEEQLAVLTAGQIALYRIPAHPVEH